MTEPEATPDSPPPSTSGLVDLSDLRMMPSWVAGMGSGAGQQNLRRYEEDESRGPRGRGGDRDRGDRRGGGGGPRRDGGGGGFGNRDHGDRPPRRDGPGGGFKSGPGGPRRDRDRDDRGGPRHGGGRQGQGDRPQREWQEIPKDISVGVEPEDKAAEALAAHIRGSGHAFSMFDAARLVLAENDRFHVRFTCAAERNQLLNVTADGGVFLSHDEALQHVLRGPALEQFYRVEEVELEEPKGDFKSIGVCGMTGELLGPPSHHSFQTSLIRLHRDRFSHIPLEDYKRRVRVESNPDLVAQWKEKQRKGYRWVALKDPGEEGAEAPSFNNRSDMEAHFRRTHAHEAVKEVKEAVVPGNIDKGKLTHVLSIMLRHAVENARKHLFEMSQKLGGNFERRGLKLFKRRAGKLFVSRVKPRAVDQGVVLSDRVARIVEVLKTQPGMPLHQLVESICPSLPPAEGEAPPSEGGPPKPPTEEQISVIKDVRWLANEGYVIEYSDGMVFLGVQGEPNPPKAAKQQKTSPETTGEPTPEATEAEAAETLAEETAPMRAERGVDETSTPVGAEEVGAAAEESAVPELFGSEGSGMESEEETPIEPAPAPEPGEGAPVENAPGEKTPETEVTEEPASAPEEPLTDISAAEEPVPPMGEESERNGEIG